MDDVSMEVGVVVAASKKLAAGLREFTLKILGPSAEQAGLIVGDWARLWRVKNLVSINEKFDRICKEKGFNPAEGRYLAMSLGLPLLEKASYQDDDFLQEKWAHLIASSLSSDNRAGSDFSLDITYVEILNQLSKLDCEILEYIVENGVKSRDEKTGAIETVGLDPEKVQEPHLHELANLSLEKLVSLGCAYRVLKTPLKAGGDGYGILRQEIIVTLIGLNLYVAASGNRPTWFGEENG